MTELFFVYGTLKRGKGNHDLLGRSKYIGKGITLTKYRAYSSGFPLILPDEEGKPMLGELYKVDSPVVVNELDRLESNGRFYTRIVRPVKILDFFQEQVEAWIYEVKDTSFCNTYCEVNADYDAYEWK